MRPHRAVWNALFHHFVPASLYGGATAFTALNAIQRDLEHAKSSADAAVTLRESKAKLFADLSARFDPAAAKALTVKILNLFLAHHQFNARSTHLISRPFGLVIDPSNVCQLACPGCVHSTRNEALKIFDWPNGTLSQDRYSALLSRYGPYAIGAYFCNYGEPLLSLQTPRLIRLAKTYLMRTALSTSLSVRKFDAEAYVESGLDFMVISIDGATQAVYQQFRRNGDLELALSNIRKLVDAKRRLGKRTPVLSWNFLAFEHNAHEIPQAERMARQLGVNLFRIVNPFDVGWDDPEIQPAAIQGGVRRLHSFTIAGDVENWNPFPGELAPAIASAFDELWDIPAAPAESSAAAGHTCHWLYKNIVMDATGRIMPCCGGPRPDTNLVFDHYNGNGGDPFNSERYQQARAWFRGDLAASPESPHCTQCEWDQTTVNIGSPEIESFFRAADPAFFDRRSLRLLKMW